MELGGIYPPALSSPLYDTLMMPEALATNFKPTIKTGSDLIICACAEDKQACLHSANTYKKIMKKNFLRKCTFGSMLSKLKASYIAHL